MDRLDVPSTFWGAMRGGDFFDILRVLNERWGPFNQPGQVIYAADNLLTFNKHNGFLADAKLIAATLNAGLTDDRQKMIAQRRYFGCWAALSCAGVPGDFVDCGCYLGASVQITLDYVEWPRPGKRAYLYDRFDGYATHKAGAFYDDALRRFRDYRDVVLVRGDLPDSFAGQGPEAVAYLHVDLGEAEPTVATLASIMPRVSPGGLVLIESYGINFPPHAGIKEAVDVFCARQSQAIAELPTGQGLIIKR